MWFNYTVRQHGKVILWSTGHYAFHMYFSQLKTKIDKANKTVVMAFTKKINYGWWKTKNIWEVERSYTKIRLFEVFLSFSSHFQIQSELYKTISERETAYYWQNLLYLRTTFAGILNTFNLIFHLTKLVNTNSRYVKTYETIYVNKTK